MEKNKTIENDSNRLETIENEREFLYVICKRLVKLNTCMAETFSKAVVGKRGVPCVNQRSSCLWQKQEEKREKKEKRGFYILLESINLMILIGTCDEKFLWRFQIDWSPGLGKFFGFLLQTLYELILSPKSPGYFM